MTRYRIREHDRGLDVKIENAGGANDGVVDAFQACQAGRCRCPTEEYRKLDHLEVETGDAEIRLRLTAKAGRRLDAEQIEQCLRHTLKAGQDE